MIRRQRKIIKRKKINSSPTEHVEQVHLIRWANHYWFGPYLFHIPNGGLRNKMTAKKLKDAGVRAGIPDLFLAVTSEDKHGLFIEMKRKEGGRLSDNQVAYISRLKSQSYDVAVCEGWLEGVTAICNYLDIDDNIS